MASMTELRTAHTADLDLAALDAARTLLYQVFDNMTEDDWDHAQGGVHALVWEGAQLIGHASVVQRRLLHGGRALRTGYVEGVVVRDDRRGRGHGAAMMAAVERIIRSGYELGALSATEAAIGFYAARGWTLWQGPSSVLTPTGAVRTQDDDGSIFVLPVSAALDITGPLVADWRDGDVW
jgi:aminoglycoside 2'-N-acetyltransferase I